MSTDPTIAYYDEHALQYETDTLSLDMRHLYATFLDSLPAGGRILDLGCGPGRDAKAFTDLGFDVTGVDGSAAMVELARRNASCPIHHMTFDEIPWRDEFHGIWACASLLHVSVERMPETLQRLQCALRTGGVLYMSFKVGEGTTYRGGRTFTNLTESQFVSIVDATTGLGLESLWLTSDARPNRKDEQWLNAVLRRVQPATT